MRKFWRSKKQENDDMTTGGIFDTAGNASTSPTKEMWDALIQQQATQAALGTPPWRNSGTVGQKRPPWTLEQRLSARMGVNNVHELPFEFIQPVMNEKGENVIVFALKEGQHMVFEDDKNLFPSDSLVSKLNLLR